MKYLMIFTLLFSISNAFSSEKPSIGEWIKNEVDSQMTEVNISEDDSEATMTKSGFYFNKIRVRVKATVGLELPLLASFEVKPFIELHFKRSNPEGFTKFKPNL